MENNTLNVEKMIGFLQQVLYLLSCFKMAEATVKNIQPALKSLAVCTLHYQHDEACDVSLAYNLQIYMCSGGHILCNVCLTKIAKSLNKIHPPCPICRKSVVIRNMTMEKILLLLDTFEVK